MHTRSLADDPIGDLHVQADCILAAKTHHQEGLAACLQTFPSLMLQSCQCLPWLVAHRQAPGAALLAERTCLAGHVLI